jgi:hypothetical protein
MKNKILLIDWLKKELTPECRDDVFENMIEDALDYCNYDYWEYGLDLNTTLTINRVSRLLKDIKNYVIDVYNEWYGKNHHYDEEGGAF